MHRRRVLSSILAHRTARNRAPACPGVEANSDHRGGHLRPRRRRVHRLDTRRRQVEPPSAVQPERGRRQEPPRCTRERNHASCRCHARRKPAARPMRRYSACPRQRAEAGARGPAVGFTRLDRHVRRIARAIARYVWPDRDPPLARVPADLHLGDAQPLCRLDANSSDGRDRQRRRRPLPLPTAHCHASRISGHRSARQPARLCAPSQTGIAQSPSLLNTRRNVAGGYGVTWPY